MSPNKSEAVALLSAVLESPHQPDLTDLAEAAAQITHTATTNPDSNARMSILVRDIIVELEGMGPEGDEMRSVFVEEVVDRAVAGFIDFWNVDTRDPLKDEDDEEENQPHPLLLSMYLGDLFSLKLIPTMIHEDCITYLIENIRSGEDLLALYMLISRSTRRHKGYTPPKLDPLFLGHAFIAIREVSDRLGKEESESTWGDLHDPKILLQHIGELFQICDDRLRFPDIPPPPKYRGFLYEEQARREARKADARREEVRRGKMGGWYSI